MRIVENIKESWYALMAKQLRKPSGILASFTGDQMNKANHLLYQQTFDQLDLQDGDHILEVGFGNGKFFPELLTRAQNLQITGIDVSHEMVTEAVRNNAALYEAGIMKVNVGSSEQLPFADQTFDKIFCVNVIYFWDEPAVHLAEILRVLKPGGLFCTGFRPYETMLKLPFTKYGFHLYSVEDWAQMLANNGFIDMETSEIQSSIKKQTGPFTDLSGLCLKAKRAEN
jgi:ubiquinone/menaquinone biosynthesis C-methylase UbiE